ncbi:MAG: phosphate ABC transporter permease subunit PstC [Methanomicrobiaceae archaeon]|nr:phosphate ABC transporter permease subunit PstC [Methanomicrobiaceae archaeon]
MMNLRDIRTHIPDDKPGRIFLFIALISISSVILIFTFLFGTASPVLLKEGAGFITGTEWNYHTGEYGILLLLIGSLVLTAVTMAIALPLSLFTAIFLAEWSPRWLAGILRPPIEMLVGIPSVVYGIFGFFILENIFQYYVDPFIDSTLGFIWIFKDVNPSSGISILLAATVLSIMILPTVTALSQEALETVPRDYRHASLALGATKWETIKKIILPAAMPGIITAFILGLMRAIGETMAIVMLMGNCLHFPTSILDTGYAMTSKILNDIGYWVSFDEPKSALFAIGVAIFVMEFIFVALARLIGYRFSIDRRE